MLKRILERVVPPSGGERFPALDGLRALAVLSVLIGHTLQRGWPQRLPLWHFAGVGVCLFFALSAFLLYYPWAAGKSVDALRYYRRRAWRIYPAYLIAVSIGAIFALAERDGLWWSRGLSQLGFTQSCGAAVPALSAFPAVNPTWSLSAEVQFYVLLPLLAVLAGRLAWFLGAAIVAGVATQFLLPHTVFWWGNWPFAALPFICGMIAARLAARRPPWLSSCAPTGLVILIAFSLWPEFSATPLAPLGMTGWRTLLFNDRGLVTSFGAALAILGLVPSGAICSRMLGLRPLRLVGIAGYGIFLFHLPVILLIARTGLGWPCLIVCPAVAVLIGVLSYLYIEAPAMRYAAATQPPHSRLLGTLKKSIA